MLLAVDVGNSQTSFGVFQKNELLHHWRLQTVKTRTADELASFLFPLLQHAGIQGGWEGVALCSVVPPADRAYESLVYQYLKAPLVKIQRGLDLGFALNIDFPDEAGADRLANAAYAVKHLSLPAVVIDIGTATTFDVVSAEPAYEGGAILPGPGIAVEALGIKTSKLPSVDLFFPKRVIGKNTVECIQSGVLYGYVDMLDGLIARTVAELGTQPEIVLTGGFAPLIADKLRTKTRVLSNLTLEGVQILFERNRRLVA